MRNFILVTSLFLATGWQSWGETTISLKMDRIAVDGHLAEVDQETPAKKATVRIRSGQTGKLLLVKAKEPGTFTVFDRKVTLDEGGQYLVKGVGTGVVTDIASGHVDPEKWVASKEVVDFFLAQKSKPIPTPSQSPIPQASPTPDDATNTSVSDSLAEGNAKITALTDTLTPTKRVVVEKPEPRDGYIEPPQRPRAGADAIVYPVESGIEPGYAVQPGDSLDVVFYRVQRATVDMKGDIRLVSAVGNAESTISAAGKTPDEIARLASTSGLDFTTLQNPAIKVKIAQFAESVVIVIGGVRNPGRITIDPDQELNIKDIISKGGGLAIPEKSCLVMVRRGERVIKLDLGTSDGSTASRFSIRPGDIITIKRRDH